MKVHSHVKYSFSNFHYCFLKVLVQPVRNHQPTSYSLSVNSLCFQAKDLIFVDLVLFHCPIISMCISLLLLIFVVVSESTYGFQFYFPLSFNPVYSHPTLSLVTPQLLVTLPTVTGTRHKYVLIPICKALKLLTIYLVLQM